MLTITAILPLSLSVRLCNASRRLLPRSTARVVPDAFEESSIVPIRGIVAANQNEAGPRPVNIPGRREAHRNQRLFCALSSSLPQGSTTGLKPG